MSLLNLLPQLLPPLVALRLLPLRLRHLVAEPVHVAPVRVGRPPLFVVGLDLLELRGELDVRMRGGPEAVGEAAAFGVQVHGALVGGVFVVGFLGFWVLVLMLLLVVVVVVWGGLVRLRLRFGLGFVFGSCMF